jgi:hypothetical protein
VLWAKDALACLGRYPRGVKQRHGYIGRALHQAIESYQRSRGLRRDSFMAPDGETESTPWVELAGWNWHDWRGGRADERVVDQYAPAGRRE